HIAQAAGLRHHRAHRRGGERGQAAVEFVLALPIVMTLILGIMDLSMAVFSYTTIANAAQEGARYAALYPATAAGTCANPTPGIGDAVCRLTAGLRSDQVRYAVTLEQGTLRVAVTYRHQTLSAPVMRIVGHGGVLELSAVARATTG
ncbi:MAG: TadE/TadG family type IV pilus assembly protein, partial [Anaerolineae bacterium]